MYLRNLFLFSFGLLLLSLTSCTSTDETRRTPYVNPDQEGVQKPNYTTQHEYGGWYCPDNIIGFPAVDVAEYRMVPVVTGRLPTKEETQNGRSLIYIDPINHPNAKALDINLPRLAKFYNTTTQKDELVIVIQAVVIDQDSIVGFRYINGGNGSSWLGEVNLLPVETNNAKDKRPYITQRIEINAPKPHVWDVITNSKYAEQLGSIVEKGTYIKSNWVENAKVELIKGSDDVLKTGLISILWKDLYAQIDYEFPNEYYTEKFLLLDNKENNSTELHIVAGTYDDTDFEDQNERRKQWAEKVKELSESIREIPNTK